MGSLVKGNLADVRYGCSTLVMNLRWGLCLFSHDGFLKRCVFERHGDITRDAETDGERLGPRRMFDGWKVGFVLEGCVLEGRARRTVEGGDRIMYQGEITSKFAAAWFGRNEVTPWLTGLKFTPGLKTRTMNRK